MKREFKLITTVALTLCVALASTGVSQAFWKKRGKEEQPQIVRPPQHRHVNRNIFSASGKFTGAIEGVIEVGNKKVFVGEQSTIYVSGKGPAERGHIVSGASLYTCGVVKDGIATAAFVVVRPANAPTLNGSLMSRDRHVTPSPTNPNVGTWEEGYE